MEKICFSKIRFFQSLATVTVQKGYPEMCLGLRSLFDGHQIHFVGVEGLIVVVLLEPAVFAPLVKNNG